MSRVTEFSAEIRRMCEEDGFEYIDAVVHWCEKNNMEVEYAASMIKQDQNIMSSIEGEAEKLNFIKKTGAKLDL